MTTIITKVWHDGMSVHVDTIPESELLCELRDKTREAKREMLESIYKNIDTPMQKKSAAPSLTLTGKDGSAAS